MEKFRQTYLRLCKDRGVEPQESVAIQLQESRTSHSSRLDLSGQSLSTDTCSALARALQQDTVFTELLLCDCMLSEESTWAHTFSFCIVNYSDHMLLCGDWHLIYYRRCFCVFMAMQYTSLKPWWLSKHKTISVFLIWMFILLHH